MAKRKELQGLEPTQNLVYSQTTECDIWWFDFEPRKSHSKEKVKIKMTVHKIRNGKVYGPKASESLQRQFLKHQTIILDRINCETQAFELRIKQIIKRAKRNM